MDVKTPAKIVKLDWSRLLGFDQAVRSEDLPATERQPSKLGAKVGGKLAGNRPGTINLGAKVGTKSASIGRPRAIKLGAKFGSKAAGTRPL